MRLFNYNFFNFWCCICDNKIFFRNGLIKNFIINNNTIFNKDITNNYIVKKGDTYKLKNISHRDSRTQGDKYLRIGGHSNSGIDAYADVYENSNVFKWQISSA